MKNRIFRNIIIPLSIGIVVLILEAFLFGGTSDRVEIFCFFFTAGISAVFLRYFCYWFIKDLMFAAGL